MRKDLPDTYTVRDLAQRLNIAERRVYQLLYDDVIPGTFRVGSSWRADAETVEAWVKAGGSIHSAAAKLKAAIREG